MPIMKNTKNQDLKSLGSFCQNRSSIKTRLALLSFYKTRYPRWIEQVLLILEYLQLMSQIILMPDTNYDQPDYYDFPFRVIIYFFKLVNPCRLFTFEDRNTLTITILIMILCGIVLKLFLFAYILSVSYGVLILSLWHGMCRKFCCFLEKREIPSLGRTPVEIALHVNQTLKSNENLDLCYKSSKKAFGCICQIFGRTKNAEQEIEVIFAEEGLKKYKWLVYFWKWIFKLQTRIIYLFVVSFAVRAIIESIDGHFGANQGDRIAISCIATLIIFLELAFSLVLETQLCYVLPTKSFLSSKNNNLQVITLLQKFVIQILAISFRFNVETNAWIMGIMGLIFGLIRAHLCYIYLPLYNIKALLLQGDLIAIVLALNVVYLGNTILRAAGYDEAGINLIILIWILIGLLAWKTSREILNTKIFNLLSGSHIGNNPETLIHKMVATKQLKRSELKPSNLSDKCSFGHLLSMNQNVKLQEIFGLQGEQEFIEELSKEDLERLYLMYFEGLATRFPRNNLVKLFLAQACFKNSEAHPKTIKIASDIEKQKWSKYYLSASLLLFKIEKSILSSQEVSMNEIEKNLDLLSFLKNKVLVENLKKEMLKQSDLYIKVCDNILSETSDIGEIYNSAQLIGRSKRITDKISDKLSRTLPDYYVSPFLICAEYHLILNYSLTNFDKYTEIFAQRYIKNERHFKDSDLIEENLYQESNAFLLLSAQANDNGRIVYANKAVQRICGQSTTGYIGNHISTIFPPTLHKHYESLLQQSLRTEKEVGLLNKVHRAFIFHKNKSLVEVDFCLKYHPYLNQSLCLDLIIRPIPRVKEFILIKENGDIEGASEGLTRLLEVKGKGFGNIRSLSQELFKANTAFNMVQNNEIYSEHIAKSPCSSRSTPQQSCQTPSARLTYQQAVEIHAIFSQTNPKIRMYSNGDIQQGRKSYEFFCNIQIIPYGPTTVKMITLQEATGMSRKEEESPAVDGYVSEEKQQPMSFSQKLQTLKYPSNEEEEEEDEAASENIMSNERELDELPESMLTSQRKRFFEFDEGGVGPLQSQMNTNRTQANYPFVSPTTSDTKRGLLGRPTLATTIGRFETNPAIVTKEDIIVKKSLFVKRTSSNEQTENEKQSYQLYGIAGKKEKVKKYVSSHGSTQSSMEKATVRAFKSALLEKSYPKSFIVLCFVFYGVMMFTFVTQCIMKFVSNTTLNDLQIKNGLLGYSQERSYKAMMAQINALGGALNIKGALQVGGAVGGMDVALSNLQLHTAVMKKANYNMMKNISAMSEDVQRKLFSPNVKMLGTYVDSADSNYQYMNSFQATDKLVNAAEAVISLDEPVSTEGYNILYYIAQNVLDGFESVNLEITQEFVNSVKEQKKHYQFLTIFCVAITPFLLIGVGGLLIGIILNQYRIEKRQMKALIKIRSSGMKQISDRIKKFQKRLLDEDHAEETWFSVINEDVNIISTLQSEQQSSGYSKGQDTQTIKYQGFRRRYYQYIFRVIGYLSVLIAINIWDWVSTDRAIKILYNMADQVQSANQISNRITTTYASFANLFISNNTLPVEGKLPLKALSDGAAEAKLLQNQILTDFQDVDGNYNPKVKAILFDDDQSCSNFVDDNLVKCTSLVKIGQPTNMVAAMAAFQQVAASKITDYYKYYQTTKLLSAAYINIGILLPNFVIIAKEAQIIGDITNEALEDKIDETLKQRALITGLFCALLLVIAVTIWFRILRRIREVYNDFKKVLQIFPPGLILSSYLLKKFLIKTSKSSHSF